MFAVVCDYFLSSAVIALLAELCNIDKGLVKIPTEVTTRLCLANGILAANELQTDKKENTFQLINTECYQLSVMVFSLWMGIEDLCLQGNLQY